jgi:vacuolar protein sorting-associated protein 54
LPRVRRKDFDSYLRAVTPEWERFEQLGREQLDAAEDVSLPVMGRPIPSLDVVPRVYFDNPFNLGDPHTFALVTQQPLDSSDSDSTDPSSLSYSLPLLEKLSHYADTIEQHLIQEISLRSTSFFAALTNLHDLRSSSSECLDRITKLRALLNEVDEKGAKRGLEVVRLDARLRNLGKVRRGVGGVEGVVEMTRVARGLVGDGRWGEALEVIEEMDGLWSGDAKIPEVERRDRPQSTLSSTPESPPPEDPPSAPITTSTPGRPPISIPLSSLKAFSNLPTHLRTLTMEIASSLTTELVDVLRIDLSERVVGLDSRAEGDGDGVHADIDQTLRDRLKPLLQGLSRTKGMRDATGSWREVVLGEVRGTIKRVCLCHGCCVGC